MDFEFIIAETNYDSRGNLKDRVYRQQMRKMIYNNKSLADKQTEDEKKRKFRNGEYTQERRNNVDQDTINGYHFLGKNDIKGKGISKDSVKKIGEIYSNKAKGFEEKDFEVANKIATNCIKNHTPSLPKHSPEAVTDSISYKNTKTLNLKDNNVSFDELKNPILLDLNIGTGKNLTTNAPDLILITNNDISVIEKKGTDGYNGKKYAKDFIKAFASGSPKISAYAVVNGTNVAWWNNLLKRDGIYSNTSRFITQKDFDRLARGAVRITGLNKSETSKLPENYKKLIEDLLKSSTKASVSNAIFKFGKNNINNYKRTETPLTNSEIK